MGLEVTPGERAAVRFVCPNARAEGHGSLVEYRLVVNRRSYGYHFRCTDCYLEFTMSDPAVRRVVSMNLVRQPAPEERVQSPHRRA